MDQGFNNQGSNGGQYYGNSGRGRGYSDGGYRGGYNDGGYRGGFGRGGYRGGFGHGGYGGQGYRREDNKEEEEKLKKLEKLEKIEKKRRKKEEQRRNDQHMVKLFRKMNDGKGKIDLNSSTSSSSSGFSGDSSDGKRRYKKQMKKEKRKTKAIEAEFKKKEKEMEERREKEKREFEEALAKERRAMEKQRLKLEEMVLRMEKQESKRKAETPATPAPTKQDVSEFYYPPGYESGYNSEEEKIERDLKKRKVTTPASKKVYVEDEEWMAGVSVSNADTVFKGKDGTEQLKKYVAKHGGSYKRKEDAIVWVKSYLMLEKP